jgi:hypothetical protein
MLLMNFFFWSHHHIFPYSHIIHHYYMTFKFEILILGQQMKMDINKFLFIYFPIMDELHQMIYLFNPIHK